MSYLELLPHRPPMRLIEEVIEVVPGERAVCTRRTRETDFYFDGHFPGMPVVPAVILIELVAQAGGLAAGAGIERSDSPVQLRVASVGPFKFPSAAGCGVLLEVHVRVVGALAAMYKIDGHVRCGDALVATGSIILARAATRPADR